MHQGLGKTSATGLGKGSWQRTWRHLRLDRRAVRRLFPAAQVQALEAAIAASERGHSGEIRIVLEGGLPWPQLRMGHSAHERALELFGHLRMWDTHARNGVLIYLLLADQRIEILADRGLNAKVAPAVWQHIVSDLATQLQTGRFAAHALDALQRALQQVDGLLRAHFSLETPARNVDELSNCVVLL